MIRRVVMLFLLLVATPVLADSSAPVVFGRSEVAIATVGGASFRFAIEVAETADQLHQGLMFRDAMADDAGMLFLLGSEDIASFWMRNTFLPLDMLFITRDGRIANIHRNAAPGSTAIISSTVPVVAVLEVNAGITGRLGIHAGDRVIHPAFH